MKITEITVEGKAYVFRDGNGNDDNCMRCAFVNSPECPQNCSSKINEDYYDGYWVEKST